MLCYKLKFLQNLLFYKNLKTISENQTVYDCVHFRLFIKNRLIVFLCSTNTLNLVYNVFFLLLIMVKLFL